MGKNKVCRVCRPYDGSIVENDVQRDRSLGDTSGGCGGVPFSQSYSPCESYRPMGTIFLTS